MIKINLLPQEMAGGRAGGASSSGSGSGGALVALVLALIFIVNVAIVGVLFVQYTNAKQRYDTVKAKADKEHAEMTAKQNEYTATQMSYDRMSKIVALDRALDPPDRVLWSRKLNMLPMLVPEGVYTTQLQVVQKASERETQESIKRRNEYEKKKKKGKNPGPAPVPEKVPVYAQTMMISGIAYVPGGTENQRLESIVQFNRNLMSSKKKLPFDKAETSFMEGFQTSVRPSAVRSEKRDGRDVQTFTFTINARPVTVETKEEGTSSEAGATSAAPTKTTAAAN
ncbi:MAG TPA: hypothetical protein PKH51_12630 [Candidatus Sumerlaeota bacterium]|nr:hypothetical protein [Candidatus Sumerlaeota bacterium]